MSKKIPAIILVVSLLGAVIGYLGAQQVQIAVLKGCVLISEYSPDVSIKQQPFMYGLSIRILEISLLEYMTTRHGKPIITKSTSTQLPYIINLSITFELVTPTNKTLMYEPLTIDKGGLHNFTLTLGPDEKVKEKGRYKLIVAFKLIIYDIKGQEIINIAKTVRVIFAIPEGPLRIEN